MADLLHAIRGLLAYTIWADRQLLVAAAEISAEDLARDTGTSHRSVLGTLAHVLGAEQLWLSRFLGVPLTRVPNLEDFPNLDVLRASWEDFWPQLEFFLASLASCYTLALYHVAHKRDIDLGELSVRAEGEYEGPKFRRVVLEVTSSLDRDVLDPLIPRASAVCYVSNTLRAVSDVEVVVAG